MSADIIEIFTKEKRTADEIPSKTSKPEITDPNIIQKSSTNIRSQIRFKLPEDLFTSMIASTAKNYLEKFLAGKITRDEVLEQCSREIRCSLECSLNTISSSQGLPYDIQKIEK
ncbi:MAG: hypothetical protein UR27_C0020G0030 [Candidatus Peregrinibacteria bacterium GW2011_GWA2_33_10]|nr:MAG: hypothetical protein UR27_C0020G0030 [Candidatus Peregrinibacteria bacterium GW2011_GWA2_33_10]KKP40096.1 MAG: hypothetical protein UR30_C0006G0001 [Candidatus Peregrinibacteria bacterium GW2011_GWC2_33_13]OGJ48282.1 MAG: hypothetical protein A2229_04055 [Candidatus Peregrinibacteria bacterium RIFOXYA2_FULL_33_7]